uniref:FLZ-type domain-containing protein n=1 Tax=Leersia perrieri TaxID=77586 RepID=A0A0D9WW29_9ORYZ
MLKKRCSDPSPLSSELTRHINGGRPSSSSSSPLLPSPRSPSLQSFSPRSLFSSVSMDSPTKTHPCASPRNVTGLAGVLVAGEAEEQGSCRSGRVLLGMRLRVQLPPPEKGIVVSGGGGGGGGGASSPIEFGVKNREAQLALLSPVQRSPAARAAAAAAEDEDYTCVIARGPNPKMTHIFDDRVVESSGAGGAGDALFLHRRGEKTFCSSQCRYHEVLFDKRIDEASDVPFN